MICRRCSRLVRPAEGDRVDVEGPRVWVVHADGTRCTYTIRPWAGWC